jgi:hypothetical protein
MGYFSLAAVLMLLVFAGGSNAARLYPTSQEVLATRNPYHTEEK